MTVVERRIRKPPILVLAGLLTGLAGCGGKSDGADGDAGVATRGGSSGSAGATPGGSPGAGGSSAGGNASVGGSSVGGPSAGGSGNGGDGSAATGGGVTIGGRSGAGGLPEGACLETLKPYDRRTRPPELQEVEGALRGQRKAPLTWADGSTTEVQLEFVGIEQYLVESTVNPEFPLDIPVTCEDHVRAIATGRLTSSDGRLDETLAAMTFDAGHLMIGDYSAPAAFGVATLESERVRGGYSPGLTGEQCFRSLQIDMTVGAVFQGSIVETVGAAPCGVDDPDSAVVARAAARWSCFDEGCWAPPSTALVVEAESCDGMGTQLSAPGDESSFTRSGDALLRTQDYGCGCADFAEFVMTWAPRSPLELRLCKHDSRNVCTAACVGQAEYGLSTAFRVSGTNEFRFVDDD